MKPPEENEYAPFYRTYVSKIKDDDVIAILEDQMNETNELFRSLSNEQANYRYAEGKWSIKELAGHMADSERVFGYRAMRIGRNDTTELPGFEQDDYVSNGNFETRSIDDITEELLYIRKANLKLYKSFDETELSRTGTANGYTVSVRALIYITAGHERHHLNVINEKYLK